LISRRIEKTRSVTPDVRHTATTLFRAGINERLQESERTDYTEREIEPGVVRYEQIAETRSGELREAGSGERLEEETIRRRDVNGRLTVRERTVTRRSEADGREQVVIETYDQNDGGIVLSDGRVKLSHRIRRTTAATADGGRDTLEEIEARSQVAQSDPLRVIRRTVSTVRRAGPDRWATQRQVFELDVNGRFVPVTAETEEAREN